MRKEKVCIYMYDFMGIVASVLYSLAPLHKPRNADIIMQKINDYVMPNCKFFANSYYFYVDKDRLQDFLVSMVESIPELLELNLTQNEIDAGVTLHNKREEYRFYCESITFDEKEYIEKICPENFIDLMAFVQNIICELERIDEPTSCFACIHFDYTYDDTPIENSSCYKTENCKTCKANPNYTYNHTYDICPPDGKIHTMCRYLCDMTDNGVCCIECKMKENCNQVCDDISNCTISYKRKIDELF